MRFKLTVVMAAFACALLFLLGVTNKWPHTLFYCEGFGCSAMGVAYLIYAFVIVVAFAIGGAVFGPPPRRASALFAGGCAALAMFAALAFLYVQNQRQIARGMEAYEAACAQNPRLCPEKAATRQTVH